MSSLKEIDIAVPSDYDFYCGNAPIEFCDLLNLGRLEKVRLLYTSPVGDYNDYYDSDDEEMTATVDHSLQAEKSFGGSLLLR